MEPIKRPEELQEEYRARMAKLEAEGEQRRKLLITYWTWVAAGLGLLAGVVNYAGLAWGICLHMAYCAVMAYLLLRFHRGHLTGIIVSTIGNGIIGSIYLSYHPILGPVAFNPFGLLAFSVVGGIIGIGMKLDRGHL